MIKLNHTEINKISLTKYDKFEIIFTYKEKNNV